MGTGSISYSCIEGLSAHSGNNNIGSDPLFVDEYTDLRLDDSSPCRDTGNSAALPADSGDLDGDTDFSEPTPRDLDLRRRVMATQVDMGAFEAGCVMDVNGDCCNNGLDIAIILGSWTGAATYSPCPPYRTMDLNEDCKVNGQDIAIVLGSWGPCSSCIDPPSCTTGGGESSQGGSESGATSSAESEGDQELTQFWWWYFTGDWEAFFAWLGQQQ